MTESEKSRNVERVLIALMCAEDDKGLKVRLSQEQQAEVLDAAKAFVLLPVAERLGLRS